MFQWASINELNKLHCLEKLRMKRNPLMSAASPETTRQLLIAKLKHLKVCNRTEVRLFVYFSFSNMQVKKATLFKIRKHFYLIKTGCISYLFGISQM